MEPVPLIAVSPGNYAPRPTLTEPKGNPDAMQVAQAAKVPAEPSEVQKFSQELRDTMAAAAKDIERFVSSMERSVRLTKDESTGYIIVQLVDPQTGAVIRSLPPDELLRIARSFEVLGSTMVNQRA
jgi:flagellar protein FlaG